MKKIFTILALATSLFSCNSQKEFSPETKTTKLIDFENKEISFEQILEKHKGKTVFIDVWASWCSDCIKSLPDVKKIKQNYKEVVFLNLSVDKNFDAWKNGIEKFEVTGEHYLITDGMKGVFGKSIGLSWIPRFIVVDKNGNVALYNATEATDKIIEEALKK